MPAKFTPLSDYILVRPSKPETEATKGGIILPEKVHDVHPQLGEVLSVGPGKLSTVTGTLIEMPVKPGQTVVYRAHVGTKILMGGETLVLLHGEDLLGKIDPS